MCCHIKIFSVLLSFRNVVTHVNNKSCTIKIVITIQTHMSISAIEVTILNAIGAGVRPIQSLCREIESESIGPLEVAVNELAGRPVHARPLDFARASPVAPEHVAAMCAYRR